MKINHLHALGIIATIGLMLTGCRADVDLQNVDTTSELSLGLQLPVGSFQAKLGDFLKVDSVPDLYFDSVDGTGTLTFKKKIDPVTRNYHQVDLSEHLSQGTFDLKIKNKLPPDIQTIIALNGGYLPGTGEAFTIQFDMPLELNGINSQTSKERLDSAQIESANFVSCIRRGDLDDLDWAYVDKIEMDLGENIFRKEHIVTVYDRNNSKYDNITDYNDSLPIILDKFTLCMMENPKGKPSKKNVLTKTVFPIYITLVIPVGKSVKVTDESRFIYDMFVRLIDYKAIWGMYDPSNEMRDVDSIDISKTWDSVPLLANATLPFSAPSISLNIGTSLAGAIQLKGDYLYTEDRDGGKHYALFNGQREFALSFKEGEYLDPYTSPIGAICDLNLQFDNTPEHGEIQRLFERTPYKMGYMFGFAFDEEKTPQIRILPSTGISLAGEIKLPMAFNLGVNLQYTDTLKDVSLSQFSIDSLLGANVKIDSIKQTAKVDLVVNITNTIPFNIKAVLRLLDEHGEVINDPSTKQPMNLTGSDTILIKAPKFEKVNNEWKTIPNTDNIVTATMTKAKLDQFPKAKYIQYTLCLDNKSMEEYYNLGNFDVRIAKDASIAFKLGLTAQLDAVLHFETQNNGQK